MAITLLTGPPAALSRDELLAISAATPSSFEGIPPLTRHHEAASVRIRVDPPVQGFTGDGLDGALWVTEEALSFFSPATGTGISLTYPHLTLHAISRQPAPAPASGAANGAPQEGGACIYCQIDESEDVADDDAGEGSREMWITPSSDASVDAIFAALSLCASLHPPALSSDPSVVSSSAHATASHSLSLSGEAAAFAAMGLDPSSMVYADADGALAGPGAAALLAAEEAGGQWADADADADADAGEGVQQHEGTAGRERSAFVNEGRARGAPY
ncbi:hypothetical protein JCM3770_001260 [Rhodotorula araucariae]